MDTYLSKQVHMHQTVLLKKRRNSRSYRVPGIAALMAFLVIFAATAGSSTEIQNLLVRTPPVDNGAADADGSGYGLSGYGYKSDGVSLSSGIAYTGLIMGQEKIEVKARPRFACRV